MKRSKCVFSNMWNESVFAPIWIKWYKRFFEPQDIYIIHLIKPRRMPFDDWLTEECLVQGVKLVPVLDRNYCDFQVVVDRVEVFQRELLGKYEKVLFAEADEFIFHPDGLDSFIDEHKWRGPFVRCTGYEVVQDLEEESSVDIHKPILPQRKNWYKCALFSKTLLSTAPVKWCWGFHHIGDATPNPDPDLLLIHLHKMDYNICLQRNIVRQENECDSNVNEHIRKFGSTGYQHYLRDFDLKDWFRLDVDGDGNGNIAYAKYTNIPDNIRNCGL
jgi:hypothetical protein